MSIDRQRGVVWDQAMRIHAFVLASIGLMGAATVAMAQTAPGPSDPLADGQAAFGKIVGDAFHRPDPIIAASSAPGSPASDLGFALRESLEVPGAVFAGIMKPFADADQPDAPVAAPVPQHHRAMHRRHLVASRS